MTTRFRLKRPWHLVRMYLAFWSMRPDLNAAPGLLRSAFLIEGPHACCTLSIWESEAALEQFASTPSHIAGLRKSQRWCHAIWSAYWRLDAVSRSAQRWPGREPWPALSTHPTHPNRLVLAVEGNNDGMAHCSHPG